MSFKLSLEITLSKKENFSLMKLAAQKKLFFHSFIRKFSDEAAINVIKRSCILPKRVVDRNVSRKYWFGTRSICFHFFESNCFVSSANFQWRTNYFSLQIMSRISSWLLHRQVRSFVANRILFYRISFSDTWCWQKICLLTACIIFLFE